MATLTKSTGTVALTGAVEKVTLPAAYGWVWVKNMSEGNIFAGLSADISEGADGIMSIPAGDAGRIQMDGSCEFYLLGSGNALVVAQNYADCPFKAGVKGGGSDVDGASSYTLTNAVDYPLVGLNLYGKSVQDGVPTPENPVEIVSAGDSRSVSVQTCGKNLFNYTFETATRNGVTCKNNGDGTYSINGTTTSKTDFAFLPFNILNTFKGMKLVGCPNNTVNARLACNYLNDSGEWQDYDRDMGNGVILNKDYPRVAFAIVVDSGVTCNNLVFKPMITTNLNATYDDFEPYKYSTAAITSSLPLCGIPVESGGNYTDSNGQQWVCDELVYNADGTGKIVKNCIKTVFDGSDDESWSTIPLASTAPENSRRFYTSLTAFANATFAKWCGLCSTFKSINMDIGYLGKTQGIALGNDSVNVYFTGEILTVDEFKNYLQTNPFTVVYQRAEPQEIELTAAEMSALRQLQTFNGITNISNDGGADMSVKYCTNKTLSEYVMPITTGLQKQIDDLKAAVLSLGGNI